MWDLRLVYEIRLIFYYFRTQFQRELHPTSSLFFFMFLLIYFIRVTFSCSTLMYFNVLFVCSFIKSKNYYLNKNFVLYWKYNTISDSSLFLLFGTIIGMAASRPGVRIRPFARLSLLLPWVRISLLPGETITVGIFGTFGVFLEIFRLRNFIPSTLSTT